MKTHPDIEAVVEAAKEELLDSLIDVLVRTDEEFDNCVLPVLRTLARAVLEVAAEHRCLDCGCRNCDPRALMPAEKEE